MRALVWGNSFIRAFKRAVKRNPRVRGMITAALQALAEDPFTPHLATHKLKGKLAGCWACTVSYDLRIVFSFIKEDENEPDAVFLMDIGTHDEVY